jgi:hypothetical protein
MPAIVAMGANLRFRLAERTDIDFICWADYYVVLAARRWVTASIVTATISTRPVITYLPTASEQAGATDDSRSYRVQHQLPAVDTGRNAPELPGD